MAYLSSFHVVCLSARRNFTKTLINDNWSVRPGVIKGNLKTSMLFASVLMKLSCRLHALAFYSWESHGIRRLSD